MRQWQPEMPATDIMLAYARRRGSIVSYDVIHPEKLRVCTFGVDDNDPGTWPMFVDAYNNGMRIRSSDS
jgi:hypothetical protein